MQSASDLNTVNESVMVTCAPSTSSPVTQFALPATSGAAANEGAHFIPNRLWSRVASLLMWSPCPDSTMIWAIVHPAGCP